MGTSAKGGASATGDGRAPISDPTPAPIHVFASSKSWIEGNAIYQLNQTAAMPGVRAVAAMPDLHPGKFGPVGAAILADRIYPQLVGSDIGCGMGLFRLDIAHRKLRLDRLAERLHALDQPWDGETAARLNALGLSVTPHDASLGSIGGGNHFCEVQAINEIMLPDVAAARGLGAGDAYVLVHSGSRGLGFAILERELAGGITTHHPESAAGQAYLASHDHAVSWAQLNRRIIAERAALAANADLTLINDLPHNLVEAVRGADGASLALHRKGAAASNRGLVPVPGSRGTLSYLVEPLAAGIPETLASLAHGAGRKYDRGSMHGRVGTKKSDIERLSRNPFGGVVVCEDRGLLVEEAPEAYKPIGRVIDDLVEFGLARVVATFRPLVTFKKARVEKPERTSWRDTAKREARR
jgi:release factor H-coupled RctB family protein